MVVDVLRRGIKPRFTTPLGDAISAHEIYRLRSSHRCSWEVLSLLGAIVPSQQLEQNSQIKTINEINYGLYKIAKIF